MLGEVEKAQEHHMNQMLRFPTHKTYVRLKPNILIIFELLLMYPFRLIHPCNCNV